MDAHQLSLGAPAAEAISVVAWWDFSRGGWTVRVQSRPSGSPWRAERASVYEALTSSELQDCVGAELLTILGDG